MRANKRSISRSTVSKWVGVRQALSERRAAFVESRRMLHDLGDTLTPAESAEWAAILSRYDETETIEIRRILDQRVFA